MPEQLTPGFFLDVRIGILIGDLPADYYARSMNTGDGMSRSVEQVKCYSTDANAAIEAGDKTGLFREHDARQIWDYPHTGSQEETAVGWGVYLGLDDCSTSPIAKQVTYALAICAAIIAIKEKSCPPTNAQ